MTIGQTVKRNYSDRFHDGETGQIIEIDGERARVIWTAKRYGGFTHDMKPVRTWVKIARLAVF